VLASLTFLTPRGGFLVVVAVIPLAVLVRSTLHVEGIARRLGLARAGRRPEVTSALLALAVCALLALAAAQPAWRSSEHRRARTASQVFFVVDVSRSMAAAPNLSGSTRLARARSVVTRLRGAVPTVPAGLAGLTDRVLPYLFPTLDDRAFAETLSRSVLVEAPPPQQVSTNATSFAALGSLARDGFFTKAATQRTCVLVTDGESRSYSAADVVGALQGGRGCRLLVVRVGSGDDRVFGADGSPEAGYTPDPAAADQARALAEAAGGQSFSESDLSAAAAALRRAADVGPEGRQRAQATNRALAPYAAILALVALAGLLAVRLRRPGLRRILTEA
jgi:hypothetical protein